MKLKDYQVVGSEWLARRPRAMLADEMGLGKSAQAIVAAQYASSGRHLIVCPKGVRNHWKQEWFQWRSRFSLIPTICEKLSDVPPPAGPIICTYEYAVAWAESFSCGPRLDCLIIDEAHLVKGIEAQRTKALFGKSGIARNAARVWWLTGTPMEHSPADLWLPLFFSGVTKLSREAFLRTYCTGYPGPNGHFRVTGVNKRTIWLLAMELKALGFFLRRTKKEVGIQLPELTVSEITVQGSLPAGTLTEGEEQDCDRERELLAHAVGDLSQLTNHQLVELQAQSESVSTLCRYLGLCKVRPVVDIVQAEMKAGHYSAIVIGYKHKQVGDALQSHFFKLNGICTRIDGDTSASVRDSLIKTFQTSTSPRVMLLQIKAGGVGISLTGANQVIVLEREWDPASLDQLIARTHRIGQTENVTARIVILENEPLDRAMMNTIDRKRSDIAMVLDAK